MLTATPTAPKSQISGASNKLRSTPKPANWHGVQQGLKMAKHAYRNNALQEAEQILRDVIEFAPEEAKAWAWLGKILLLQQQREEAGNCFKRAESLLSRNLSKKIAPETPVSKPLAKIFWQQGDTDTALEMLSVLLLKNPGDDELKSWQKSWATGSNA